MCVYAHAGVGATGQAGAEQSLPCAAAGVGAQTPRQAGTARLASCARRQERIFPELSHILTPRSPAKTNRARPLTHMQNADGECEWCMVGVSGPMATCTRVRGVVVSSKVVVCLPALTADGLCLPPLVCVFSRVSVYLSVRVRLGGGCAFVRKCHVHTHAQMCQHYTDVASTRSHARRYDGEWMQGKQHGRGYFTTGDKGSTYDGMWHEVSAPPPFSASRSPHPPFPPTPTLCLCGTWLV